MKFKKTVFNLLSSSMSQFLTLVVAFLLPRLYIVSYGSEVNGLLSSISQIFAYFALLEAGVGAATQQALYKYFADYNTKRINEILAATNYYYKRIGCYYLLLVVGVAVVYPYLVPVELNHLLVTGTIILIGSGSVINFWFQGKYRILLTAEGKGFINDNISMVAITTTNIIKIVLLLRGYNIIIIQVGYLIVSLGQAVVYGIIIKKKYPWIDFSVSPDFQAISQSKAVLVHQITSLVFNNTDMLLLTFVCRDLKIVSLYSIYGLIYNNIDNITATLNAAYKPLLGQLYFENRKKFTEIFEISEVFYMAFSFSLYFVAFLLTPWFVNIYTSGADMSYADFWVPVLFVTMKLLAQMRRPLMGIIDLAGDFKKTQGRTVAEMLINLGSSIILIWKFGIYGVLSGTILALLYRCIDVLIYVPKHLVEHSPFLTVRRWTLYVVLFVLGYICWSSFPHPVQSVPLLFVNGIILSVVGGICFFALGALTNRKETRDLIALVKSHSNRTR